MKMENNDYRPLYYASRVEHTKIRPSEIGNLQTTAARDIGQWYKDRSTRSTHYKKWESIYEGKHKAIWGAELSEEEREKYVTFNVIKPIVHTIARLLVLNDPQFSVQDDEVQEWLDKVIKNNQLLEKLESAVVSGQVLGGLVVRTGYKQSPTLEFIHPEHVEPLFDKWDATKPLGFQLVFENEDDKMQYRKTESYVENYYSETLQQRPRGMKDWQTVSQFDFEHEAGMLCQYVPFSPSLNSMWGSSIVEDNESLLKEVNNRMTRIKRVLDIFSSPKLVLPPSLFDNLFEDHQVLMDNQGTKYVRIMDQDIYCLDPNADGEQMPEYLTWDANLESTFTMLKQVLSAISVMTDVPAHILRPDENSAPQSGAALKLMFTNAFNRAMSIARVLAKALETALWQAQMLEKQIGTELNNKNAEWVTVRFVDALPLDENYIAVEIDKYNNDLQSRETTIRNIDNYNKRQLDEEIARIEEEKNKTMESQAAGLARKDFSIPNVLNIPISRTEGSEDGEGVGGD